MNVEFSLRKCANLSKNGCSGCLYEGNKGNCFSVLARESLKEIRDLKSKLSERQTLKTSVDNNYFELTDRNLRFIEAVAHDLRTQSRRNGVADIAICGDEAEMLSAVLLKVYQIATPVERRMATYSHFSAMPEITAMSEDSVPEGRRVEREEVHVVTPVNRRLDEEVRRSLEQAVFQAAPVSAEAIAQNRSVRAVQSLESPRFEPVQRPRYRAELTGVVDTLGQSSEPLTDAFGIPRRIRWEDSPWREMQETADRLSGTWDWSSSDAADAPPETSAESGESQT